MSERTLMTQEPTSVDEAFRWIESILSEQPHGKSYWQIEQEKNRVCDLVSWIRERIRD